MLLENVLGERFRKIKVQETIKEARDVARAKK
jgi:hypothetical protein